MYFDYTHKDIPMSAYLMYKLSQSDCNDINYDDDTDDSGSIVFSPNPDIYTKSDSGVNNKSDIYSHQHIYDKLNTMILNNSIPNLLFHGGNGSGKRTVVDWFIRRLYGTSDIVSKMAFYVNCVNNSGIQYIRNEINFIAKRNIHPDSVIKFKTIIFLNASKLTIDAQSALRRCIEIYGKHNRFIFVTSNKQSISKPILSRMGSILVIPKLNGKFVNVNLNSIFSTSDMIDDNHVPTKLIDFMDKIRVQSSNENMMFFVNASREIISMGYSALDVISYMKKHCAENGSSHYNTIACYESVRSELKNECAMVFTILLTSICLHKDTIRQDSIFKNIYPI